MRFLKAIILIAILGLILPIESIAQDFVYTPVNSHFGGNSYNYNWLLNSANQQNRIEDPNKDDEFNKDPLDDFETNLKRQILNQLSSRIVNQIFGDEGDLESGTYNLGSYQVDIFEDPSGLNLNILDMDTGNFSNINIPTY